MTLAFVSSCIQVLAAVTWAISAFLQIRTTRRWLKMATEAAKRDEKLWTLQRTVNQNVLAALVRLEAEVFGASEPPAAAPEVVN